MMISSIPSEKLKEIVEKNGESILLDPSRCEGLLKDHCGGHRREISAIVGALEERVPMELKSSWQTAMTPEAMRARMVQRLEENRGLAPEVAGWAVDAWSYALGVGLERKSDKIDDKNFASVVVGKPLAAAATPGNLHGDRPSTRGEKGGALAMLPAALVEMKPQKKAGVGVVAALVIAGVVFAITHHPTPTPGPPPQPVVVVPPTPTPTPTPKPAPSVTPAPMLAVGTPISISLNEDINSETIHVGDTVSGTVISPLTLHGNVVVPRGAEAMMRVTEVDESGKYSGRSRVDVTLVELSAAGHRYRVTTPGHVFEGPSQEAHTAERAGIGAGIGAVAGFIGGKIMHHAKAGTVIGAGAGGTLGGVTGKSLPVKERAETVVQFRLSRALDVGTSS